MTAISAAAMRVRTMADGSLRIEVEVEPQDAQQAFALFGRPGAPMALAALAVGHAAVQEIEPEKPKGGQGAKWLAIRCADPAFQLWLQEHHPHYWRANAISSQSGHMNAASVVRAVLSVESRAELDSDPIAQERFHRLIRGPYALHCVGVTA